MGQTSVYGKAEGRTCAAPTWSPVGLLVLVAVQRFALLINFPCGQRHGHGHRGAVAFLGGEAFARQREVLQNLLDQLVVIARVEHAAVRDVNFAVPPPHIDPEGLLSTIPSIAHVLIGFCVGKLLMEVKDIHEKLERLFLIGTILTFAGFLFSYGCPFNKKIWSPTFVLVTCGLGSSLLALLVWIIDIKGCKKWSRFFESFGVNPLFIYVMAGVIAVLVGAITVTYQGESVPIQQVVYRCALQPVFGDEGGSLAYAILFVLLNWSIGYILYKKKIYIKI